MMNEMMPQSRPHVPRERGSARGGTHGRAAPLEGALPPTYRVFSAGQRGAVPPAGFEPATHGLGIPGRVRLIMPLTCGDATVSRSSTKLWRALGVDVAVPTRLAAPVAMMGRPPCRRPRRLVDRG